MSCDIFVHAFYIYIFFTPNKKLSLKKKKYKWLKSEWLLRRIVSRIECVMSAEESAVRLFYLS